jgi:hypothetical protein
MSIAPIHTIHSQDCACCFVQVVKMGAESPFFHNLYNPVGKASNRREGDLPH